MEGSERKFLICGTLGGVYSHMLLYEVDPNETQVEGQEAPGKMVFCKGFLNEHYETFYAIASGFMMLCKTALDMDHLTVVTACFSVAGPVDSNRVTFTNRANWVLDGYVLERQLGISRIALANDYVCIGYGLATLNESETVTIQEASPSPGAPKACIGARTGLGECFLTYYKGSYKVFPSEGGHCEFAPTCELEVDLLHFLKRKFGENQRVSVERVASTGGLENVYEFLCERYPEQTDTDIHRLIAASSNKAGAIVAHSELDPLCKATTGIFITTLAGEAGCCALKYLPYGGLFIYGPAVRKMIKRIKSAEFMRAFSDKGRVSPILRQIPVKVVMADRLSKRGAHYMAFALLKQYCQYDKGRHRRMANVVNLPRKKTYGFTLLVSIGAAVVLAYQLLAAR